MVLLKRNNLFFDKNVVLDEIDALIEIKKPVLKLNNFKEQKIIISQKDIRNYLLKIIE